MLLWGALPGIVCCCEVHYRELYAAVRCITGYCVLLWGALPGIVCCCQVHYGELCAAVMCIAGNCVLLWGALRGIIYCCEVRYGELYAAVRCVTGNYMLLWGALRGINLWHRRWQTQSIFHALLSFLMDAQSVFLLLLLKMWVMQGWERENFFYSNEVHLVLQRLQTYSYIIYTYTKI